MSANKCSFNKDFDIKFQCRLKKWTENTISTKTKITTTAPSEKGFHQKFSFFDPPLVFTGFSNLFNTMEVIHFINVGDITTL